ncbi:MULTISPECIES: hypothetical protein [Mesorhizobium]|uniref:hypothetical protein n=1 Tax=Mesorhizobium TaxID=68287 RepID=UPI0003CE8517|nr:MULTISPECIES: hypothetical protein [Mesorhizobium]ESY71143.1 hypothetical protein X742_01485 [Mesorhizobium sp. LNHC232B00]WJI40943.1 hypothetical protein NL534_12140 [Mesorhizobium opportunistum]
MKVTGESWENWLYPMLLSPPAQLARSVISRRLFVDLADTFLRRRYNILDSGYFQSATIGARYALLLDDTSDFERRHLQYVIGFFLEMADMMDAPRKSIKRRIETGLVLRLDGLRRALSSGRPILAPTIQTSVPLHILFANLPDNVSYKLILHRQHPGIPQILTKADPAWSFVFLDDRPGRAILEAFRSSQVVVCNIDYAYPGSEVVIAKIFTRAGVVPSGIFRAARRHNAQVVPIVVSRSEGRVVISAEDIHEWDHHSETPLGDMLARIQPIFDSAVAQAPPAWMGWGNLAARWRMAAGILRQTDAKHAL